MVATEQTTTARAEDVGNIMALEHVNVTQPDQALATVFYIVGMGFTRDPYMQVGLENMWVNVGQQQFHLPTRGPQVLRGHVGLVLPDLDALQQRLRAVESKLAGTRFAWAVADDHVRVTCPWGNELRCFAPGPRFGDMTLGMPYVECTVTPGTTAGIGRFYEQVLDAPVAVADEPAGAVARVQIGRDQTFAFRETDAPLPPYDGHHIAIYVANFSGPFTWLQERDRVTEGVRNHQFRFQTIVDPETNEELFTLEHEVRSLRHYWYTRALVNRPHN
jgi:hypothetical protein